MSAAENSITSAFFDEGDKWLEQYEALARKSPDDEGARHFVAQVAAWLLKCVEAGLFLEPGSPQRRAMRSLLEEWNSRLRRDGHKLQNTDRLKEFKADAGVPLMVDCPYPGLDAYREKWAGSFFGRAALVEDYTKKLRKQRILMIIGGSGSGKSSVALAGIRYGLHGDPNIERHKRIWLAPEPITPGKSPVAALIQSMADILAPVGHSSEELTKSWMEDIRSAPGAVKALCGTRPMLLVVDQFEELFTLCRDPAEHKVFGELLLGLVAEPAGESGVRVLLTMRTDHLARFEKSNGLKALYKKVIDDRNFEPLPALDFDAIRMAIQEPAASVKLRFVPPTIVDRLAGATVGLSNGLPLLQFALQRLWLTRPGPGHSQWDLITQKQLDALPSVSSALGNAASGIWKALTKRQQQICERLLLELVVLDDNFDEPLRRRRNRRELLDVLHLRFPGGKDDVATVEQQFVKAGLLRHFGTGEAQQIEVTHEALLRHWEHMRVVVDNGKQRLHAVTQITREAIEWSAAGRNADRLKQHGRPLGDAIGYLNDGWLSDPESTAYIGECQHLEEQTESARQVAASRAGELAGEQRKRVVAASAVAVMLVIGGVIFWSQSKIQKTNLAATASWSQHLPRWEALNLAYTLASRGGPGFRFALSQALERTDESWRLTGSSADQNGATKDLGLFPTQNGTALLQFDRNAQAPRVLVYLLQEDGSPKRQPVEIALDPEKMNRLTQVHIGRQLRGQPGAHWAILAMRGKQGRGFEVASWLLEGSRATQVAPPDSTSDVLRNFDDLSTVTMHADGDRAVLSAVNYTALSSRLFEFSLARAAKTYSVASRGGGAASRTVTAVAYSSDGKQLISGQLDGGVYCGPKNIVAATKNASPVVHIVSSASTPEFVFSNRAGFIAAADCGTGARKDTYQFPLDGDPTSLKLTDLKGQTEAPLAYFTDSDKQLRCYQKTHKGWEWYRCNSTHPLRFAVIHPNGVQTSLEQNELGLSVVRRFPVEGSVSAADKDFKASASNGRWIRWTATVGKDITLESASFGAGNEIPWVVAEEPGKPLVAQADLRRVESASLSANGEKLAWIELRRTRDNQGLLQTPIASPDLQRTIKIVRTMAFGANKGDPIEKQEGRALAVAVANDGTLAHFQASKSAAGSSTLHIGRVSVMLPPRTGEPACLAFSDDGKHVVLGTRDGSLIRFDAGKDKSASWSRSDVVRPDAKGADRQAYPPPTACAVSDKGKVLAGYLDGTVWLLPAGEKEEALHLTQKAVHRFEVAIRQVSFTDQRRLTVVGDWQINNCSSPGLPGHVLRMWDLDLSKDERGEPVANACFPNEAIIAVHVANQTKGTAAASRNPPAAPQSPACGAGMGRQAVASAQEEVAMCLIGPRGSRWHECPGCSTKARNSETDVLAHLQKLAEQKGASLLSDQDLKIRYGVNSK